VIVEANQGQLWGQRTTMSAVYRGVSSVITGVLIRQIASEAPAQNRSRHL
jgi:hypothetical protein